MIIDKQKKVIVTQLRRMITTLVFALGVMVIMLAGNRKVLVFGLNKYNWALVITAIYFLSIIIEGLFEYNYIYFSDAKKTLTLRFFSLGYFNRKKQSIEIPISEFSGYKIEESFYGIKQKLILFRNVKNKEAQYPSVSITFLNKKEKEMLINTLNQYKAKV